MSRYLKNQKENIHLALDSSASLSVYANHNIHSNKIQVTDNNGLPFININNSDLQSLSNTCDELLKEYNFMLIDKGYAIKRSELRKKDTIDLRQAVTYDNEPYNKKSNAWSLPDMPFGNISLDEILINSWYTLIPCFHNGVIQLNDARYIQYDILNIDTIAATIDIKLTDYSRMNNIWQIGIQTTVHYDCHILNQKTTESLIQTKEAMTTSMNADNDTVRNAIANSIFLFFINNYVTNYDNLNYEDIYTLIPPKIMKWSKSTQNVWNELIIKYAKQNYKKLKQNGTTPAKELTKVFTQAVLLSNMLLEQHKPKAIRNNNTTHTKKTIIPDKTAEQPRKLIRTVGPISMTSVKPPKLPTKETVIRYKTAVWKSRGGVRRLKNGKLVPFKESIKHRKCLKDTTENIPQSIIQFKKNNKEERNE